LRVLRTEIQDADDLMHGSREKGSPPAWQVVRARQRFFVQREAEVSGIRMLEALGVRVACFYMLGFPLDTPESCRATIDYACTLNTYGAQFSVFTPYPGTPAFAEFAGKVTTRRWEDFTQFRLVFRHDSLDAPTVGRLLADAYRRYYGRPEWLWKFTKARFGRR